MAKKKTTQPPTLAELAQRERPSVIEALQIGGYFPDCTVEKATGQDWTHVFSERFADLMEHCRFDLSDPLVNADIRRDLARIVATCQAWDEQLTGEK